MPPARILLVDDEATVRRAFRLRLEAEGHSVWTASDGIEALECLDTTTVDLVITDIGLPKMSGLELARKAQDHQSGVLTIVMTGAPSVESATEAIRTGVHDYLTKPVQGEDLERAVRGALELKRLREENERLRSENDVLLAVRTAQVKESSAQIERLSTNVPGVLFQCIVDAEGTVEFPFVAESCLRILGLEPKDVQDRAERLIECFDPAHQIEFRSTLLKAARNQAQWSFEGRARSPTGDMIWLRADSRPILRPGGKLVYDGVLVDISARKEVEAQLAHAAFHDNLTGLPNRAYFLAQLETLIATAKAGKGTFALLLLDLDRFKVINDSLGHGVGDRVLISIARRLESRLVDANSWIARLGGDEFVVVVRTGEPVVTHIAHHILKTFSRPVQAEGRDFFISMSIGIAPFREGYLRPEEVMRDADLAMYRAKAMGSNRFERFDDKMQQGMIERLRLETDLQRAVEGNQFVLHYQPIVAMSEQKAVAVEALVRWKHPTRGMINPSVFIPLAEEIGLIHRIGQWVLTNALAQMVIWRRDYEIAHHIRLNVNLSTYQFRRPDLVTEIRDVLRQSLLPPESLTLEITESAFLEEAQGNIAKLEALREIGVHMLIDDFGVGYSNLSYLARLPVDGFKIDRSFIEHIENDPTPRKIVRAIVELARSLGLSTTAEGVETEAQLNVLAEFQQEHIQGFYFARPMDAERFAKAWLA